MQAGGIDSVTQIQGELGRWVYVEIGRFFPSSKRCHCCGFVSGSMPLYVRSWNCPECLTEHDRDTNAAINIII